MLWLNLYVLVVPVAVKYKHVLIPNIHRSSGALSSKQAKGSEGRDATRVGLEELQPLPIL